MLKQKDLQQCASSAIASPGEAAPVLTVTASRGFDQAGDRVFQCEASLMSGISFNCEIPDRAHTDQWGVERPQPILNDLAVKLVTEVPKHVEAMSAARVFINFIVNSEDEAGMSVSPWNWERPLSDFLASSPGSAA
mmetsp:Transcript_40008/g.86371  ORF Transcript_40008/g.86371 Transcript_40008/m.86371 type:complete len:136 (-) Transcript_40008:94-501(-)